MSSIQKTPMSGGLAGSCAPFTKHMARRMEDSNWSGLGAHLHGDVAEDCDRQAQNTWKGSGERSVT